jgi:integrase
VQADAVLAAVRKLFNWHAARTEEFETPIVKGMSRAAPAKERARERTLEDLEIRAFWRAAEAFPGPYGYLLYILLTATRLREASNMTQAELSGTVWTIPAARHKNKTKAFELPLSKAATELLASIPRVDGKAGWIFSHDGRRPIGGFSKFKRRFDKQMLADLRKDDGKAALRPWIVHDLRRTARTLMSRAGVQPRHAEMALGHVVQGVEGVYDRHRYLEEKRQAFEALAAQLTRILNPQDVVVPLRSAS